MPIGARSALALLGAFCLSADRIEPSAPELSAAGAYRLTKQSCNDGLAESDSGSHVPFFFLFLVGGGLKALEGES